MAVIGFHASHELYSPAELLRLVKRADAAGFTAAMCSDHFHPWTARHGESGYAWSWLGAALEATELSFGTVCAPGQRYHPAVVAQAAATLAEMYGDRFWLAVGTGEAINESITGDDWPEKAYRRARLLESVYIMRALWSGEEVTHRGRVKVQQARLFSLPQQPPLLLGAAITENTAEWVGGWADGLITVGKEPAELRKVIQAFHDGGGAGKPMFLQSAVAYANCESDAQRAATEHWAICGLNPDELQDIATPKEFDRHTDHVLPQIVEARLRISSDIRQHIDWLQADIGLGFDAVYLHNVGGQMSKFIDIFASKVLPSIMGVRRSA